MSFIRQNHISKGARLLCALLLFLTATLNFDAQAQNTKVRVGWCPSPYCKIDSLGRRSGYDYEYLQHVAAYAGWTYEFVDGEIEDLFPLLVAGDIDLLGGCGIILGEPEFIPLSSRTLGREDYFIIAPKQNTPIKSGNAASLAGMRIGARAGSIELRILRKWVEDFGIDAEIVKTEYTEEPDMSLIEKGEIDAIVASNIAAGIDPKLYVPVVEIGSGYIKVAVNAHRPELKHQLNRALSEINAHNPSYNDDMFEKYFTKSEVFYNLTAEELDWIRQHGTITIGFRDGYLPFSGTDPETGEPTGLVADFITKVESMLDEEGIHFRAIPYATTGEAHDALRRGEIDVAFPSGISSVGYEENGLITPDPIIKSAEVAVIRSSGTFRADAPMRAAVNKSNPSYNSRLNEIFPNWKAIDFGSTEACCRAIADNEADVMLTSSYRLGLLADVISQYDLKVVTTGKNIEHCFAVKEGNNVLFSIMSRTVHMMGQSDVHTSLATHSSLAGKVSFTAFLRTHVVLFITVLLLLVGLFALLLHKSHLAHRRANKASEAKSRFLFNMSHDIRTPMNAIIGYTELLTESLEESKAAQPKWTDYLGKIRTSGELLLSLINNVLEMSRIESGKVELDEKPYFISEIADEISLIYADLMAEKGITFSFGSNTEHSAIYCDKTKLKEVYLNLLSNAYKYTPAGGSVTIFVEEVPHPKAGYINMHASVIDTGQGMSPEYLPHLFEDFTREKTFTDNKIPGTGLGMSIVKRIVDLMGGTISVESKLGQRTTFTFTEGTEKD